MDPNESLLRMEEEQLEAFESSFGKGNFTVTRLGAGYEYQMRYYLNEKQSGSFPYSLDPFRNMRFWGSTHVTPEVGQSHAGALASAALQVARGATKRSVRDKHDVVPALRTTEGGVRMAGGANDSVYMEMVKQTRFLPNDLQFEAFGDHEKWLSAIQSRFPYADALPNMLDEGKFMPDARPVYDMMGGVGYDKSGVWGLRGSKGLAGKRSVMNRDPYSTFRVTGTNATASGAMRYTPVTVLPGMDVGHGAGFMTTGYARENPIEWDKHFHEQVSIEDLRNFDLNRSTGWQEGNDLRIGSIGKLEKTFHVKGAQEVRLADMYVSVPFTPKGAELIREKAPHIWTQLNQVDQNTLLSGAPSNRNLSSDYYNAVRRANEKLGGTGYLMTGGTAGADTTRDGFANSSAVLSGRAIGRSDVPTGYALAGGPDAKMVFAVSDSFQDLMSEAGTREGIYTGNLEGIKSPENMIISSFALARHADGTNNAQFLRDRWGLNPAGFTKIKDRQEVSKGVWEEYEREVPYYDTTDPTVAATGRKMAKHYLGDGRGKGELRKAGILTNLGREYSQTISVSEAHKYENQNGWTISPSKQDGMVTVSHKNPEVYNLAAQDSYIVRTITPGSKNRSALPGHQIMESLHSKNPALANKLIEHGFDSNKGYRSLLASYLNVRGDEREVQDVNVLDLMEKADELYEEDTGLDRDGRPAPSSYVAKAAKALYKGDVDMMVEDVEGNSYRMPSPNTMGKLSDEAIAGGEDSSIVNSIIGTMRSSLNPLSPTGENLTRGAYNDYKRTLNNELLSKNDFRKGLQPYRMDEGRNATVLQTGALRPGEALYTGNKQHREMLRQMGINITAWNDNTIFMNTSYSGITQNADSDKDTMSVIETDGAMVAMRSPYTHGASVQVLYAPGDKRNTSNERIEDALKSAGYNSSEVREKMEGVKSLVGEKRIDAMRQIWTDIANKPMGADPKVEGRFGHINKVTDIRDAMASAIDGTWMGKASDTANKQIGWGGSITNSLLGAASKKQVGIAYNSIQALINAGREGGVSEENLDMFHRQVGQLNQQGLDRPPKNLAELAMASKHFGQLTTNAQLAGNMSILSSTFKDTELQMGLVIDVMKRMTASGFDAASLVPFLGSDDEDRIRAAQDLVRSKGGTLPTGFRSELLSTLYGVDKKDKSISARYMASPFAKYARAQGIETVFKKLDNEKWLRTHGGREHNVDNLAKFLADNPEDAAFYEKMSGFNTLTSNNPVVDSSKPENILGAINQFGTRVGEGMRKLMPWTRERAQYDENHKEVYERAQKIRDAKIASSVNASRGNDVEENSQPGDMQVENRASPGRAPAQASVPDPNEHLGPLQGPAGTVSSNPLTVTDKLEDPDDYLNTQYELVDGAGNRVQELMPFSRLKEVAPFTKFDFSGSGGTTSTHEQNMSQSASGGGNGRGTGGNGTGKRGSIPPHVQNAVNNQKQKVASQQQAAEDQGLTIGGQLGNAMIDIANQLGGNGIYDNINMRIGEGGNINAYLSKKKVMGGPGEQDMEYYESLTKDLEPVIKKLTETFKQLEERASGLEEGFESASDVIDKFKDGSQETVQTLRDMRAVQSDMDKAMNRIPDMDKFIIAQDDKDAADYVRGVRQQAGTLKSRIDSVVGLGETSQLSGRITGQGGGSGGLGGIMGKFSDFMDNPDGYLQMAGLQGLGWAMFAKGRIQEYMMGPANEDISMYKTERASEAYLERVLEGADGNDTESFAQSNRRRYYQTAAKVSSGESLAGFQHLLQDHVYNEYMTPDQQAFGRTVQSGAMAAAGWAGDNFINLYLANTLLKKQGGVGSVLKQGAGVIGGALSGLGGGVLAGAVGVAGLVTYGLDSYKENNTDDWRGGFKSTVDNTWAGWSRGIYDMFGGTLERIAPGEGDRISRQYGTQENHDTYGAATAKRLNEYREGTKDWGELSGGLYINDRSRLAKAVSEQNLEVDFKDTDSLISYIADLGGLDDKTEAARITGNVFSDFNMNMADIQDTSSPAMSLLRSVLHLSASENLAPDQVSSYITNNIRKLSTAPATGPESWAENERILNLNDKEKADLGAGVQAFAGQMHRLPIANATYEEQSQFLQSTGQSLNQMKPYVANWAQELYMPTTEYGYNLAISQGLRTGLQTMDVDTFLPITWGRSNALEQRGFELSAESAMYNFSFSRNEMGRNYAWDQKKRDRDVAWTRYQYGTQVQSANIGMAQQRASFGRQMEMSGLRFEDMLAGQAHQTSMFGYQMQQQEMGWRHSFADMDMRASQAQESFGMQMRERGMQRNMMMYNYAFQEEGMDISRDRQFVQRDWQDEDLAYGREMAGIQFAWGQEDSTRNIRLSTGRQKRELIRQRDRAEITYGMEEGQRDRQEGRVDTQREWEDTDYSRNRKQFEDMRDMQVELFDVQTAHAQRNHEMQMESMSQQRSQLEETIALQRVINSENETEMKRTQASAKQLAELQIADDKARMADEEFNHERRLQLMENEHKRWEEDANDRQKRAEEDLAIAMKDSLMRQEMWQDSFKLEVAKWNLVKEQEVATAAMQANFMKIAKEAMPEILKGYDELVKKAGGTKVQWTAPQAAPSVTSDAIMEAGIQSAIQKLNGGETGQGTR